MTTRTIVTSQPDVACDVCERRLLRGEQPDVFIAAGRRRTVCELCAPRAAHEGWMRESDTHSMALPPMRPRRGRSLLDRLRNGGRPASAAEAKRPGSAGEAGSPHYDFLHSTADPVPARERRRTARAGAAADLEEWPPVADPVEAQGTAEAEKPAARTPPPRTYVERALDVFNASEFPRRVAGVARSLGAPEVSARSAEHLSSVVIIVVAWELCWYRYEVDLSDGMAEVRVLEQGTELSELAHDDRLANALADDAGTLSSAIS
jgi:hypothetical protein